MLGILLGLIVLMVLAYIGWSILWVAPIAAGVVAIFGGLDLLDAYKNTYMEGFVSFAKSWFPVFMLGEIFGKLMEVTGMARSVALILTKEGVERLGLVFHFSAFASIYQHPDYGPFDSKPHLIHK
mgnify:CR=1 FL=1